MSDVIAAVAHLEVYLDALETNEPINRDLGNVEQADLEAANACQVRSAIRMLDGKGSDFRSRLRAEHGELSERSKKLRSFVVSEAFGSLPQVDREDLWDQLSYMESYLRVVKRRLDRLADAT